MGNTPVANGACPSGWTMFQNKCFFKQSGSFTHDACYTSCQSLTPPARLLCIESAAENANIYASFTGNVWIGLSDSVTEGTFQWPSTCPSSYMNFRPGEPNGDSNSNYVILTTDGVWDDVQNTDSNSCQCEIYAIGVPTSPPTISPSARPTALPTSQPSSHPTRQPISRPSGQPSSQPSRQPSSQPVSAPSGQPSVQPSRQPSVQPTAVPSAHPTVQPSSIPSSQPSVLPSAQPTSNPSTQPSCEPTSQPSGQPSSPPSNKPTEQPTSQPTVVPSAQPSEQPSSEPTAQPTDQPTAEPTAQPTAQPSTQPSGQPSRQPTSVPTVQPSAIPSAQPSTQPSSQPSGEPTGQPTDRPSAQPSVLPSTQPSSQPSCQPSTQPSTQPSSSPSAQPTVVPSTQPSAQPSCRPSSQPSVQPSSRPSGQPSSAPSSQPSHQPTGQPSSQPTLQPSVQPSRKPSAHPTSQPSRHPSARPSSQPSAQPSHKPSSHPTAQPSVQPSNQPSSVPTTTGEWTSVVDGSVVVYSTLSYFNGSVWVCGGVGASSASCLLANALTGELTIQFQFPWDTISTKVIPYSNEFMITGRTTTDGLVTSSIARCVRGTERLVCDVKSMPLVSFVAAVFNAYFNRIVYVGMIANRAAVALYDPTSTVLTQYVVTAPTLTSVVLTSVDSPPNFLGTFVAGTCVGSSTTAVKYIFAGWLRSDTGQMAAAIGITPVSGSIVSTAGLVNAMALEATGPDSFIAGGLELSDGAGVHAYVVRVNALYKTVQFGVRYRAVGGNRRQLDAAVVSRSVVKGVALTSSALYAIVDVTTSSNHTSLSVLKLDPASGAIISQARVSSPNADIYCSSIVAGGAYLILACSVSLGSSAQAVLIAVDMHLSFIQLPSGFTRHSEVIFQAESLPIRATAFTMTTTATTVPVTDSQFTTSDAAPSRRPSVAPSLRPSVSKSSAPSVLPSSAPTSSPSVSTPPTSLPSTHGPTRTPKPTVHVVVTSAPTGLPSVAPTVRPSVPPAAVPTARPTTQPSSARPSTLPSASPTTSSPSVRPSRAPTVRPTTSTPSVAPTIAPSAAGDASKGSDLPAFVIGASVGGAVCCVLCGLYVLYRRRTKLARMKVAAKKHTGRFVVSGDMSVPDFPALPVVMAAVTQWQVREAQRNNRRRSSEELIATTLRNRARTLSAVSSTSFYLSSLHTSERSVATVENVNYNENNVNKTERDVSESSVYSESSSEDHSSSDSGDSEYFDMSSGSDLSA